MSQQQNETQRNGSTDSTLPPRQNNEAYAATIRNANASDVSEDLPSDEVLSSCFQITYYTVHGLPVQTVRFLR